MDETAQLLVSLLDSADSLALLQCLGAQEVHGDTQHEDEVNVLKLLSLVRFVVNLIKYSFHINIQNDLELFDAIGS